jgi:hypothetical protein
MKCKQLLAFYLALLIPGLAAAQSDSEVRSFIKTVKVSRETSLQVINKYGTVHISPWNKDSASIRAEIKAFAPNQSKLDKMFDGIVINFTEAGTLVRAQTEFNQNIGMLFENFKGMTSKIISYDSRVEINYYISIPEYLNLRIENKYGDVYMENCSGTFSASVSNGAFKANSLGSKSTLTLAFCDAKINSLASGKIDASFSDINIGETGDITISSISSKYEIKKGGEINTESRRDKFFIHNAESLKGNAYFTDYNLNSLKKTIDLTARYGSVTIDIIENGFTTVNINSGYSDLSLGFDPGASYKFDIHHINSYIGLPDKNTKSEEKVINDDKKEYMTYGTTGKNPGEASVKIDANRGNIYLKQVSP